MVLEKYDSKWDHEVKNISTSKNPNPEMISEFERLFNKWSEQIENYLEDADQEKKEDKDAHPK